MIKLKKSYLLIISFICLLFAGQSLATTTKTSDSKPTLNGIKLAHDTGYPHYHGDQSRVYKGSGRIRSYQYCSQNVFEPCRNNGGSFQYCNRLHHLCTYGHLRNCIAGETC